MPWTKGDNKPKAKWVSIKHFAEYLDLSKATAYHIAKLPEMKEAVRHIGSRGIRINMPLADEILKKIYD